MKKSGSPLWFPNLVSWLRALTLSVLIAGLLSIINHNNSMLVYASKWSNNPELVTILLILLLLSPIPAIALLHHFFLSRFIPTIPGERMRKQQGLLPGLVSWWESLYGWLVFVLSALIATVFCTPFIPLFKLNYKTIISTYSHSFQYIEAIFILVWLLNAALFYQIEYLVKLRFVFGEPLIPIPENQPSNPSVDINNNPTQTDIDKTQIQTQTQTNEQPIKNKQTIFNFFARQKNLPKKIFIIILVPLVILWLYLFAKLPETKQAISTNLALKNSSFISELTGTKSKSPELPPKNSTLTTRPRSLDLPLTNDPLATKSQSPELPLTNDPLATKSKPSELPLTNDTYEKAIKQGKRAAKLSKTAQSYNEWKIVANKWKRAIDLLEAVPLSSPNYAMAQEKILQYQAHLDFARQNAGGGNLERKSSQEAR